MAEALYNKYRPQIFEDVVGQEHIERTLKNAIAADKISHAYMFTGPRGTGKTTTARLLAKALLCQMGPTPEPDGSCEDCRLVAAGEHPDVYELDAASRTGVENVREEIIGKVNYAPTRGRYKVYIIDEVHMLSTAAFNALLKTLEEPPSHVVFVLCTTDPQKVPETIQSRCQRFDFRRISSEELISRLGAICEMEGVSYEGDALDLIAHRANGGMRDALTSLDQLIAFGEGAVTSELAERLLGSLDSSDLSDIVAAIGRRDAAACFRWTSEYMETGADLVQFVQDLTAHMRDMYVMSLAGADVALEVTEAGRRELQAEMAWYGPDRLARMLGVLGDLAQELKTSTNQRLSFEIALTRMVRPDGDLTLAALAERLEQLERGAGANGAVVAGSGAAGAPQPTAVAATAQAAAAPQLGAQPQEAQTQHEGMPSDGMHKNDGVNQLVPEDIHAGQGPDFASDAQSHAEASPAPAITGEEAHQFTGVSQDAFQLWASTIAHLKKIGPAYAVVFMNTAASIDGKGHLEIAFPQDSEFAFKAAQKQEARVALEKALARAGAEGMPYQIVKGDVAPAATPAVQAHEADSQMGAPDSAAAREASAASSQVASTLAQSASTQQHAQQAATEPAQQQAQPEVQQAAPQPEAQPEAHPDEEDSDFADFLTAAFGQDIVIEEVSE